MNYRNIAIVGGIAAAMGWIGLSLYEPSNDAQVKIPAHGGKTIAELPKELKPIETGELKLAVAIEGLKGATDSQKPDALDKLSDAYDETDDVSAEMREKAGQAIAAAWRGFADGEEGQDDFREEAGKLLVTIGGTAADEATADLLSGEAEEDVRVAIIKQLATTPGGHSKSVYEAAFGAIETDDIPAEYHPFVLRRALGKKSEERILALFDADTSSSAVLKACAVELQEFGKPELMGRVLAKLDSKGMLESGKTMPWFSGRLLGSFIKTAKADELGRALKVMQARPALTKAVMPAARERIADVDPAVRRMIAKVVPHAVKNEGLDPKDGESILADRLGKESDPAVKLALEDSLAQVRETRPPQQGEEVPPTTVR
jgi:hypothetical protein